MKKIKLEKSLKESVNILQDYIGATNIETYICKGEKMELAENRDNVILG